MGERSRAFRESMNELLGLTKETALSQETMDALERGVLNAYLKDAAEGKEGYVAPSDPALRDAWVSLVSRVVSVENQEVRAAAVGNLWKWYVSVLEDAEYIYPLEGFDVDHEFLPKTATAVHQLMTLATAFKIPFPEAVTAEEIETTLRHYMLGEAVDSPPVVSSLMLAVAGGAPFLYRELSQEELVLGSPIQQRAYNSCQLFAGVATGLGNHGESFAAWLEQNVAVSQNGGADVTVFDERGRAFVVPDVIGDDIYGDAPEEQCWAVERAASIIEDKKAKGEAFSPVSHAPELMKIYENAYMRAHCEYGGEEQILYLNSMQDALLAPTKKENRSYTWGPSMDDLKQLAKDGHWGHMHFHHVKFGRDNVVTIGGVRLMNIEHSYGVRVVEDDALGELIEIVNPENTALAVRLSFDEFQELTGGKATLMTYYSPELAAFQQQWRSQKQAQQVVDDMRTACRVEEVCEPSLQHVVQTAMPEAGVSRR